MSRREAKGPVTGPKTVALVPAAGRGLRMGGHIPKQFLLLGGLPILAHSLRALQDSPVIHEIILAVPEAERRNCLDRIVSPGHFTKVTKVVSGGEQRQDSVRHALAEVDAETEFVLVHDAVRPFLTQAMIREVVAAAQQHGGHHRPPDAGYGEACGAGAYHRADRGSPAPLAGADAASVQEGLVG
ncbi:MAG: 2-C-methyl-D-erythritol 4-phosphate cytidylyltransferase [Nitrospiraceae bacterium]